MFDAYGRGPRPRVNGGGQVEDVVLISNSQHVVIIGFEITNTHTNSPSPSLATRRGVHIPIIRLNDASGVKTLLDGQGFDSDYNSHNTRIEFNLSHDNQGGFLLICAPGNRNEKESCGNVGTVARYNISRHDGARTFHVTAAEKTLVRNNAIYAGLGAEVQLLLLSDWSGWANGLELRDNLLYSEGVGRYGHQVSRNADGTYGIAPGCGPATNIVFRGICYVGRHEDRFEEASADDSASPKPILFKDWPSPRFDPRRQETFSSYLRAHRSWMLRLMERQFGRRPMAEGASSHLSQSIRTCNRAGITPTKTGFGHLTDSPTGASAGCR